MSTRFGTITNDVDPVGELWSTDPGRPLRRADAGHAEARTIDLDTPRPRLTSEELTRLMTQARLARAEAMADMLFGVARWVRRLVTIRKAARRPVATTQAWASSAD